MVHNFNLKKGDLIGVNLTGRKNNFIIDDFIPTEEKIVKLNFDNTKPKPDIMFNIEDWNVDGSSTGQSITKNSDDVSPILLDDVVTIDIKAKLCSIFCRYYPTRYDIHQGILLIRGSKVI
jgi:hypothetical protein